MKSIPARPFLPALLAAFVAAAPAPIFPADPALPAVPALPASPAVPVSFVLPRISARLDRTEVAVGETVALTVEVSWEGEAADPAFEFPSPPDCHLLTVESSDQESAGERSATGWRQARRYHYRLRAREEGEGRIGYVAVAYRRAGEDEIHTLKSEPLDIVVSSSRAPLRMAFPAALALILIAGAAVILRRARKRKIQRGPAAVPAGEDWKAEALENLARAKRLSVEGDQAGVSRALFQSLSLCLEKRFGVNLSRDHWRASVDSLPPETLSDAAKRELIELVRTIEQARFGSRPEKTGRDDALLKQIRSLIEWKG